MQVAPPVSPAHSEDAAARTPASRISRELILTACGIAGGVLAGLTLYGSGSDSLTRSVLAGFLASFGFIIGAGLLGQPLTGKLFFNNMLGVATATFFLHYYLDYWALEWRGELREGIGFWEYLLAVMKHKSLDFGRGDTQARVGLGALVLLHAVLQILAYAAGGFTGFSLYARAYRAASQQIGRPQDFTATAADNAASSGAAPWREVGWLREVLHLVVSPRRAGARGNLFDEMRLREACVFLLGVSTIRAILLSFASESWIRTLYPFGLMATALATAGAATLAWRVVQGTARFRPHLTATCFYFGGLAIVTTLLDPVATGLLNLATADPAAFAIPRVAGGLVLLVWMLSAWRGYCDFNAGRGSRAFLALLITGGGSAASLYAWRALYRLVAVPSE